MSCFKLPAGLCQDIEALIRRFFWGQRGENRKIHWVKWRDLCKSKSQGGMRFKDLSMYNDAMLDKQAWRLLHDTNSLLYRVFKPKFFPDCSIMEAKVPNSASHAWKSIIKGREVIRKGGLWRIGDGRSINFWTDNWVPLKYKPKLISPVQNQNTSTKVDGEYTVKSGYQFLMNELHKADSGPSSTVAAKELWHAVWHLQVPSKVKNLVWRACRNSLPTKMNLVRRKIITDDNRDPRLFSMVVWALWNRRNNIRLAKEAIAIGQLLQQAQERLQEFSVQQPSTLPTRNNVVVSWHPPARSWYKVNFDCALFEKDQCAGIGVVIRNDQGLVMASLSQRIPLPFTVIEAEALAARRAIEFAAEIGLDQVIMEGDSKVLINTLRSERLSLAQFGHIVKDVQNMAAHFFKDFNFSHVCRLGNKVAHSLARRANKSSQLSLLN
uniref:RNase H type-1 domain-containing protein n=1 Tax=Quercus lobata TaxID=97700 RepID=A0A7N2N2Z4_QUELO